MVNLQDYDIDEERGFLPSQDPIEQFNGDIPHHFKAIEEIGENIPELIENNTLRTEIEKLDAPEEDDFEELNDRQLMRVYNLTGFLASAYVHKIDDEPKNYIPEGVAVPLYESTNRLNRKPILSYDAYALNNWRRKDASKGFGPHNIETLTNFVDMLDEQWFIVIHIVIEKQMGSGIAGIKDIKNGIDKENDEMVLRGLRSLEDSLHEVVSTLERMPEHNSPENYGPSFRPYIEQFKNIEYNGVDSLEHPQSYRGETGAQSSIFPTLDALFGIDHKDNPLVRHVEDMKEYMPPNHRRFIEEVAEEIDVEGYVTKTENDDIVESYNTSIDLMIKFREIHHDYAEEYIKEKVGDDIGTGGTPYEDYLTNLIEDTERKKVN